MGDLPILGLNKKYLTNSHQLQLTSKVAQNTAKVPQYFLWFVVIITACFRLLTLNKGFDITDEGYCLLGFEPLQERLEVISSFHTIVFKLFAWANPGIIAYRSLSLIITILASIFFGFSFWYWFKTVISPQKLIFSRSFILLLLLFGGFALDYDSYATLNYNTLNNAANLGQAGLVLIALTVKPEQAINSWKFKLLWLATGFLAAFQFFIKPPSAINFMALLSLILLLYQRKLYWRYYIIVACCLIIGFISGILAYFGVFQNFEHYQELLARNLAAQNTNLLGDSSMSLPILNNPIVVFWRRLLGEFKQWIFVFFKTIWFYLGSFLLATIYFSDKYLKKQKNLRFFNILVWVFAVLIIILLVEPLILHLVSAKPFAPILRENNITKNYYSVFAFLLVILFAVNWGKFQLKTLGLDKDRFWKIISIAIFFFLLPGIAAMGTNTSTTILAARNIVPWLALIIILLTAISQQAKAQNFVYLFVFSLIFWLLIKINYVQIYKPYRLVENRLQQTESVNLIQPHAKYLKVDIRTKKFLEELTNLVQKTNFKPGDPIIALYDMPGLVYLMDGVSPGATWYFGEPRETPKRTCSNITYSSLDKSKAILLVNNEIESQVSNCLKVQGVNFPSNYQKVGEVFNPYHITNPYQNETVAVWMPKL